jgi:myo-inositol 2-dehydrogenase/D-chiro-inositol 1-dehydrogenase
MRRYDPGYRQLKKSIDERAYGEPWMIHRAQWITAAKAGRVDGPTAGDGYVGSIAAAAASRVRDTKSVVNIDLEKRPPFYETK